MRLLLLSLATGCCLSAGGLAQTTWIVDGSNGPGTHFTDLPLAVAAAADGDTILVRPGTGYGGFTTGKALKIFGTSAVLTYYQPIAVTGLPAGKAFFVHGLGMQYGWIDVAQCQGEVHFESISGPSAVAGPPSVSVTDSPRVTLQRCQFAGGGRPSVNAMRSILVIEECTIKGQDGASTKYASAPSEFGLRVEASTVTVSGGWVRGGAAGGGMPGSSAVHLVSGSLTVTGDAATILIAGAGSAVQSVSGTLLLASKVTLVPENGFPAISGGASVTTRSVPALQATSARLGSTMNVTEIGNPGDPHVLLLGLPSDPIPMGAFGTLWLDPALLLNVSAGALGPSGTANYSLAIPNNPSYLGARLGFQTLSGSAAPWNVMLSPPSVVLLH